MQPTNGRITQRYATYPQASGEPWGHTGDDFAGNVGDEVRTISDGVVIHAGWDFSNEFADKLMLVRGSRAGGNFVVVEHGGSDGWYELMAHLSSIDVRVGQTVKRGQRIGGVGATGNAQGSHLHYETIGKKFITNRAPFGRYDPQLQVRLEDATAEAIKQTRPQPNATKILTVTADVAHVRTAPRVDAPKAPEYPNGIKKGASIVAVGYVAGQDPYPNDGVKDNAWVKTKSNYYMWANTVGNDISGLRAL